MTHIDRLNRRLGEALGYIGANPRFAWKYAPEVQYYHRPNLTTDYERRCWADRIGKVWVLCQYRAPELTREQWWASFHGEFPYPANGMYYAHPEVAINPGREPDSEDTARVIYMLRKQMGMNYAAHLNNINEGLELDRSANEREFMDMANDWFPFGWKNGQAHEPGKRGAHISFGGV